MQQVTSIDMYWGLILVADTVWNSNTFVPKTCLCLDLIFKDFKDLSPFQRICTINKPLSKVSVWSTEYTLVW